MKKELLINQSSLNPNKYWFIKNDISLTEERILYFLLSSLLKETKNNNFKVYENFIKIKEIHNWSLLFKKSDFIRRNLSKSINNLQNVTIKTINFSTKDEATQEIFSDIEYIPYKGILIKINKHFANSLIYNKAPGKFMLLSDEILKYKHKSTPKLERILKQKVFLDHSRILHIPEKILREALGTQKKYKTFENFKSRILNPAIRDLNKYSYLQNVKIIGQKNVDLQNGTGRVSFNISASKRRLKEISPEALQEYGKIMSLIENNGTYYEQQVKNQEYKIDFETNEKINESEEFERIEF